MPLYNKGYLILFSGKYYAHERTTPYADAGLKENAITFNEVIQFIETYYQHQPTAFKNGDVYNQATQNQGSAKVFALARLNNLSAEDTLYLFAEHYQSVLMHPHATDHQNIRQFMAHGWPGIIFEGEALVAR